MNIQTMKMQKAQKVVNKGIIVFIIMLLSSISYAQEVKEEYIILNKIANSLLIDSDFTLTILERGCFSNDDLDDYYRFKYYDELSVRVYEYDEALDTVVKLSEGELYRMHKGYFKKFDTVLDSILTKRDLEYLLSLNVEYKWNQENLGSKIKIINVPKEKSPHPTTHNHGNRISKPLFWDDGAFAIVWVDQIQVQGKYMVFEKNENEWKLRGEIINVF